MGMIVIWPVLARIEDSSGYRYAGATSYLLTRVSVQGGGGGGGGHYISACTSTRDRGQDLDPANFHA